MRSRTGRELAERALARLALELGDRVTSLTVIGGLNADLLTLPQEAAHQGTVDIDVLVEIGFVFDREEQDLGWVERGLVRASFSPLSDEGWRWETRVETAAVVVDLLCDVPDNHGREIPLPGRPRAGAMNLAGPGAGQRCITGVRTKTSTTSDLSSSTTSKGDPSQPPEPRTKRCHPNSSSITRGPSWLAFDS